MKKLIFFAGSILLAFVAADIVITPNPKVAEFPQFSNATIKFNLVPWPPPCCKWNHSDGELYREVLVELTLKPSSGSPPRKLCEIEYELGKWKEETGRCSQFDERMFDFFPDMSNGISFTLAGALVGEQGPVELKISYKERMVSDFVDLVVTEVPLPPNITASLPGELMEGNTTVLRCSIVGCSPPPQELTWSKRTHYGGVIPIDPLDYKLADLWIDESWSTIQVGPVSWRDHGIVHRCNVRNKVRESENGVALIVRHDPHVTLLPCQQKGLPVRIVEGNNINLECEVSAYPQEDNNTLWKKNDQVIPVVDKDYLIKYAKPSDAGKYSCTAKNVLGVTEDSCTIDIQYGAKITLSKEDITIREGGSTEVICSAEANPKVNLIHWIFAHDSKFNQDGDTLRLTNIQPENAGIYSCRAENILNPTDGLPSKYVGSKDVNITVEYKARWTKYAWTKYAAEESKTALLQCHSSAFPIPVFYWTRSGSNMTSSISSDSGISNLTIENVRSDQFGTYECHVVNAIGHSTFEIQLQKPGKPDAAQACTVKEVTAYKAILTCINGFDGGQEIWYETQADHGGKLETETLLNGDMTSVVTSHGLHPNTNYTLKVFTKNQHGRSDASLIVVVRTADGTPIPEEGGPNVGAICGGIFGSLAVILLIAAVIILYRKRNKSAKNDTRYLATKASQREETDYSQTNPTYEYAYEYSYEKKKKSAREEFEVYESDSEEEAVKTIAEGKPDLWEINRDQVEFHNFVGEGAFTQVWSANLTKHNTERGMLVAVKIVKGAKPAEREKLLTEIELMKTLESHPNVISLLACSTKYEPVMMVMEYATNGRLLNYLRQLRNGRASLTLAHLTSCAAQVVNAMHYISSLKLLHKDLAARSVLLDGDLNCKLSDLTVRSSNADDPGQERISLRWMAPEWLFHNVHTSMSDVWSLGVLLWEIITLGSTPWPGYTARQVSDALRNGERMPAPPACPPKWYDMMCECWRQNPAQRPSWDRLRQALDEDLSLFYSDPQMALPVSRLLVNATDMVKNLPGEKC